MTHPCARCGSLQDFRPRTRSLIKGEKTTVQEVYVRCNACKRETIITKTTDELEELSRTIRSIERKIEVREEKGLSTRNLHRALRHRYEQAARVKFRVGL